MSAMDVLRDHIGGGLGVVAEGHFHDIEARRRPPGTRDPDCGHDRLMQAVLADVLNQRSKLASFKQWKHVGEGMELVISSSSRNSAKRS